VKGRSEWRKREEAKSGDYDVRRASWRQSWVLPEADSPTTSVTEAVEDVVAEGELGGV
jgi:hypothetical protein